VVIQYPILRIILFAEATAKDLYKAGKQDELELRAD